MWSRTASRFEGARVGERELNDRQRQILGLIERGHTNREIADLLGLSIDGAKWNVSEILTKLGLDSREEAAEYWRSRRSPTATVTRALRALFSAPALKWTALATGLGSAAGVSALMLGGGSGPDDVVVDPPTTGFYVEAAIHTADPERPTEHVLRWWHQDADHVRWDYDQVAPAIETDLRTTVVTGQRQFEYARHGSTFRERPAAAAWGGIRTPADVVLIGPTPYADINRLMADLSRWGDGSVPARIAGHELFQGRPVTVVAYISGSLWLDEAEMLIVRHHSDRFRAELTRFERRPVAPAEVAFDAAVAARPTATPFPQPGTALDVRSMLDAGYAGLLRPSYLPGALEARYTMGGGSCGEAVCVWEVVCMSFDQMMANQRLPGTPLFQGEYVRIAQRVGLRELPDDLKSGQPVPVRGVAGYLDTSGTNPVLSWQEPDGRIVRMEGSQVAADELVRIAEGLRAAPPGP